MKQPAFSSPDGRQTSQHFMALRATIRLKQSPLSGPRNSRHLLALSAVISEPCPVRILWSCALLSVKRAAFSGSERRDP